MLSVINKYICDTAQLANSKLPLTDSIGSGSRRQSMPIVALSDS